MCAAGLRDIAYSQHLQLLLTATFTPEASLYPTGSLKDGSTLSTIKKTATLRGHISGLTCCAFMGQFVAVTCDNTGYIRFWDMRVYECYHLITPDVIGFSFWNIAPVFRAEEGFVKVGHMGVGRGVKRGRFVMQL